MLRRLIRLFTKLRHQRPTWSSNFIQTQLQMYFLRSYNPNIRYGGSYIIYNMKNYESIHLTY